MHLYLPRTNDTFIPIACDVDKLNSPLLYFHNMVALAWASLSTFVLAARAGTTIWSGNFDYYATVADFDTCIESLFVYRS